MNDLAEVMLGLLNGDWRRQGLEHYCLRRGCCENRQVSACVNKMVSVLAEAVFNGLNSDIPAANRWYTFGPSMSTQCLGLMCHRVLARVIDLATTEALQEEPADADVADHALSFVELLGRKVKTSHEFLCEAENEKLLCMATAVLEPVDKLSARLQHLDAHGSALAELVSKKSPETRSQQHLFQLLSPASSDDGAALPRAAIPVPLMIHHFPGETQEILGNVRKSSASLSAQIWARSQVLSLLNLSAHGLKGLYSRMPCIHSSIAPRIPPGLFGGRLVG